jgi:hypothetical protein
MWRERKDAFPSTILKCELAFIEESQSHSSPEGDRTEEHNLTQSTQNPFLGHPALRLYNRNSQLTR